MVTVKTFVFDGNPNTVNKTLTEQETVTGLLNASFDILNPVLRFRTATPVSFNYCYINELQRYYFVKDVAQDGDLCTVRLNVDVLFTYKDKILQATGTMINGENSNRYSSNRSKNYDMRPILKQLEFDSQKSFADTGKIVMVTIKGNK